MHKQSSPTILVVHVSIFFLILFTAFSAFQYTVTKIHEQEGNASLGPFQLAINYGAFMIMNLFVAKYSEKYSEKWMMAIPALAYAFHYCIGFFLQDSSIAVKYILTGLGATINGIGSSFLWTSVGTYIHKLCHLYNVQHKKGYYYGLFSIIYAFSGILGALIVTFGLQLFDYKFYFLLTASVAILSFVYCVIFIKDLKKIRIDFNKNQPNAPQKEQERSDKKAKKIETKQQILKIMAFYKIMAPSLGCIAIDGIIIGVSSSTMLHLLPASQDSQKTKNLHIGFCMLMYGVGGTLGGFLGGKACDILRTKKTSLVSLTFYMFVCILSLLADQHKQLVFAMICCFIWGFSCYFLEAVLLVICSRVYGGAPQSFAIVKQFHSFTFIIYQIISIPTHNSLPVTYIMIFIVLITFPAAYGVTKLPDESKQQQEALEQDEPENKESLIIGSYQD